MSQVEHDLRDFIRDGINVGELRLGGKLPPERDLAKLFGVSRGALRACMQKFEAEGIIVREVGRGTFLTDVAVKSQIGTPPHTSPAEVMQARLVVEPSFAALAAGSATPLDLEKIAENVRRGGESSTFDEFERWDSRFHRQIAEATQSQLLLGMFDLMNAGRSLPVWGSLKRRRSTPAKRLLYQQQHEAIVAALAERNGALASGAMRAHLEHVRADLLQESGG